MRIALLGGSFDPPHVAHQLACLYLLEGEGFQRVWLLPCHRHAFGKVLADYEHRIQMCALAAKVFSGRVVVSEVEQGLAREDGNRSVDTIGYLQAHHPEEEFTLAIGSDILGELDQWKDIERLKKMVSFLVLKRSGFEVNQAEIRQSAVTLPRISSSQIRERLKDGQPVAGLVPQAVVSHIKQHSLYRTPSREH